MGSYINASNGVFVQVGRDQYNISNNTMSDEMVADAYLGSLPHALRAGYSSGNHKPCLKGTREGVLSDIETWEVDETNESVYWLKGVAGCGKSTVAQTFAERSAKKGNLGASFFCSRDYPDRRNLRLIFLTLAHDLAYWSANFKIALVPIIRANPNVQYDSLPVQLEKLLVRPFKQTSLSVTIVVDALDECDDKEPVSEFLSALALHVYNMPTVKFFITGRPEDRIRSGFKLSSLRTKELPLHDVESATVDSDIKSFLSTQLEEIATRRRHSISGQWPSDRDIATILNKTSGLFIIAAVIIRFVDSPYASPQKRLKLIVDLPNSTIYEGKSGIDMIYHQILSASFGDVGENDPDFFGQLHLVVGSIVLALKPLSRANLAKILEKTPESIWTILTHLHSVLIVPESESEPIRILHKSFADFVTDKRRCPDGRYLIDAPTHHSELGIQCLKLMEKRLMKNICGLPRYAINNDIKDLPARRDMCIGAPLSYACSSWAKHLQLSSNAGGNTCAILDLVNDFFAHHLLSWLEVLSIEGNFHIAIYSLHDVRLWLINNPDEDLLDLVDDCERFVLRSFDGMEQSAMHIYCSALHWAPTSSLTRKLYELMTETNLVNAVGANWDACIRIIPAGGKVEAVVFSPKGGLIATHGKCCIKVFDTMTGVNRSTFDVQSSIYSVVFSVDDDRLASCHLGGTINVWDVQTGTLFQTFQSKWEIYSITFSPCGTMICGTMIASRAHGRDSEVVDGPIIHVWDVQIGTLFRAFKCDWWIYSVAFSPCGTMIASGGSDGAICIWNVLSDGCDFVFRGHLQGVRSLCWPGTKKQLISGSDDGTARTWDVQRKGTKIFANKYGVRVTAVMYSPGVYLVAWADEVVNVYDSQSSGIIHTISSQGLTHFRFSIDGDKILLASKKSGSIWDLTRKTHVRTIDYNGDHATFSPDGTCVASIYGKFLKIWKTKTGYQHHEASTQLHNAPICNVYISPDERLVTFTSPQGTQILDAITGLSLFTFADINAISIGFSPNSAFVACLAVTGSTWKVHRVQIWNTRTRCPGQSIEVDNDVFHIALSPSGSQIASLSRLRIELWDLESEGCLARLDFGCPLEWDSKAWVSFSIDGSSVFLENTGDRKNWRISYVHDIDRTRVSTENSDGTKSYHVFSALFPTQLPMVFVPIMERSLNQDASAAGQSYRCDTDCEWIMDQYGRRVLWIPPDERPRRSWSNRPGRKVVVETASGRVYIVDFSGS